MEEFTQAQQALWFAQPKHPDTIHEAIEQLANLTEQAQAAYQQENLLKTQQAVEDLLAHTLITMKCMEVIPAAAIERVLKRFQTDGRDNPTLHVYPDQAVLKMGSDIRGRFPLYTESDYTHVKEIAQTFGCTLQHHDSEQLSLLSGNSNASHQKTQKTSIPTATNTTASPLNNNVLPLTRPSNRR